MRDDGLGRISRAGSRRPGTSSVAHSRAPGLEPWPPQGLCTAGRLRCGKSPRARTSLRNTRWLRVAPRRGQARTARSRPGALGCTDCDDCAQSHFDPCNVEGESSARGKLERMGGPLGGSCPIRARRALNRRRIGVAKSGLTPREKHRAEAHGGGGRTARTRA